MIYYQDGAKMMRPVLSREEYLALRGTEKQKAILKTVREGDVVIATLRFSTHDFQGQTYQEILATDIVKLNK